MIAAETTLQDWLAASARIEGAILSTECLDVEMVDAVGIALERRQAHVRVVLDYVAPDAAPRFRVRVVDRCGAWWLVDSWGLAAPRPRCPIPAAKSVEDLRGI